MTSTSVAEMFRAGFPSGRSMMKKQYEPSGLYKPAVLRELAFRFDASMRIDPPECATVAAVVERRRCGDGESWRSTWATGR
jgi:hypothetical protein